MQNTENYINVIMILSCEVAALEVLMSVCPSVPDKLKLNSRRYQIQSDSVRISRNLNYF